MSRNVQYRISSICHQSMEKLSPEEAVEILRKHGTEVSIQEAEKILEFLRMLAEIQVAQYIRQQAK